MATYGRRLLLWSCHGIPVMSPLNCHLQVAWWKSPLTRPPGPSTADDASGCREYSQRLHFHLSQRRACENNLLQPDLVVDFPPLFLKTHTKELCLVKSHSVPEKVRRHVDPGCLAEMLLLLLQVLLIIFRASFA